MADWRRVVVVEDLDGDLAAGDEDAVGDRDLEAVRGDQLTVQRPAHVQFAVLLHLKENINVNPRRAKRALVVEKMHVRRPTTS